jgi:3-oxoacyl-[acyl-carrier-protein] synthase III
LDQDEPLIVGFAETPYTTTSGRSVFDLAGDVHAQLLEAAGLDNGAIDGLVVCASTTEAGNPFWSAYFDCWWCETAPAVPATTAVVAATRTNPGPRRPSIVDSP